MSTLTLTQIKTPKQLSKALNAFNFVKNLSDKELETLEILSNKKDKDYFFKSLEESKLNTIESIQSIL